MDFSLLRAEKDLFSVYHMLYAAGDIEMWFDWDKRLSDAGWSDECYFIVRDGVKIGGAILTDEAICNAFLIPPFCYRVGFWRFLLKNAPSQNVGGASDADARVLLSLGHKILRIGQVMARPADDIPHALPNGFLCRPVEVEADEEEVCSVIKASYAGGICEKINGVLSLEETKADFRRVCGIYSRKSWSHAVIERETGKMAAACLAGSGETYAHGYGEIAEVCVLPQFRHRGLAGYMVARAVSEAKGSAPFVKLFVYIGNSAQSVYESLGFIGGPRFTDLTND